MSSVFNNFFTFDFILLYILIKVLDNIFILLYNLNIKQEKKLANRRKQRWHLIFIKP